MSKNKSAKNKSTPKSKAPEKEPTQEVTTPAAEQKPDLKAKHRNDAVTKAREAFKALGLSAPKAFDAIESGTATAADYKALKEQTDSLKTAVNQLGCHFQEAAKG